MIELKNIYQPKLSHKIILITLFFILAIGQLEAAARSTDPTKQYPFGIEFTEATPAQYFFLIPAHFGGTVFTAISCFAAWPVSAAWNASHGHTTRRDLTPPVPWAARTVGLAGAYLVGSPFWCMEQAFWEFPVWLFSDENDNDEVPYDPKDSGYRLGTGI